MIAFTERNRHLLLLCRKKMVAVSGNVTKEFY